MDEIKNEALAAERMIEQIEANQAKKAQRNAERAKEVVEAEAHAQEVASHIAAGDVVNSRVSEPVTSDSAFDPATEAEAGARMIDSLLAKQAERAAKHARKVAEYNEQVLEEAKAAAKVTECVKSSTGHLK
jgi:hypothetical protein